MTTPAVMALVRRERSGRTRSHKKTSKRDPPKQNIALFFHNSTMTVSLCLHLNFRAKLRIMYSIESDDLFFREHYVFETKLQILDIG